MSGFGYGRCSSDDTTSYSVNENDGNDYTEITIRTLGKGKAVVLDALEYVKNDIENTVICYREAIR